ncbi:MAG: T9SS type A sorting domain-containing protein [Gemmatimonadetes bacterium]|nr:T9SS type A sorting domain-containing protein [Gemmatimonadota bacterium]MBT5142734.1 T9SS type A sorting domain-containing protein [Gemmatimonadota bacterium]MBT5587710.1 T9SS type A sorting domain-containing protein [Gemmatimonadota bacterium]MBT5960632.1 T9SS type A sorting domain-containing protein [Gemmatimonadota bacterium]MBT6631114.1 T9SS type A sorting domain-containing protein [Gemmatimonadota bacterium]
MKCQRVFSVLLWMAAVGHATDRLTIAEVRVDRPTLHNLGVQVLIDGDDDRDAQIEVRWRRVGDAGWRASHPLLRVWPETVWIDVPRQFAGSIFDLQPGKAYEIELMARDPDGGDSRHLVTATTRPIPVAEPADPRVVDVGTEAELREALRLARPGDVIQLAAGVYPGTYLMTVSGTQQNPIVVRGEGETTILDGGDCTVCDVLDVRGSWVHVEDLRLQSAVRGLRFSGVGAIGNVARRLHIRDVVNGIGKNMEQVDFYLCDNIIEGRLEWPWVLGSDATAHWDDRGVDLAGDGHVVCHNLISGFGDPVVNKQLGSRAWDVYGNDIADVFDGTELDEATGNVRLYRNRFTNAMDPISIQPIHGGPAYVLRNVGHNIVQEQIKLKSLGGQQMPSGALIFHNSFTSPTRALNSQAPITQYNFQLRNNLFIGPPQPERGTTVDWTTVLVGAVFESNGYWPDGGFWFGRIDDQNQYWESWAAVQGAGRFETDGVLLEEQAIFAAGFVGGDDPRVRHEAPSFILHQDTRAIDAGSVLPGINSNYSGKGPDLGAIEFGCEEPHYGPRGADEEAVVWRIDCMPEVRSTDIQGAMESGQSPMVAALHPNVPNPFNPHTQILFDLPRSAPVRLTIHDMLGRRVRTLLTGFRRAGTHRVDWDGRDLDGESLSSGVYFYRLVTQHTAVARSMLLLR